MNYSLSLTLCLFIIWFNRDGTGWTNWII